VLYLESRRYSLKVIAVYLFCRVSFRALAHSSFHFFSVRNINRLSFSPIPHTHPLPTHYPHISPPPPHHTHFFISLNDVFMPRRWIPRFFPLPPILYTASSPSFAFRLSLVFACFSSAFEPDVYSYSQKLLVFMGYNNSHHPLPSHPRSDSSRPFHIYATKPTEYTKREKLKHKVYVPVSLLYRTTEYIRFSFSKIPTSTQKMEVGHLKDPREGKWRGGVDRIMSW